MHDPHQHPPLIKILTAPTASGEGGEFQFAHLSFQEFLFLETFEVHAAAGRGTPLGFKWASVEEKAAFLCDKFYRHCIEIGAPILRVQRSSRRNTARHSISQAISRAPCTRTISCAFSGRAKRACVRSRSTDRPR